MAALRAGGDFQRNVFINCPFDDEYRSMLRPLLFTVVRLGFVPRIASERSDSGEGRFEKISKLMRAARFSIHDISRLRSKSEGEFSRFNLPFELGVDMGARLFGARRLRSKRCLLLESSPHDYKRALSDLSGVDIKHHGDDPQRIVRAVRDWFVETVGLRHSPGPTPIWYGFLDFSGAFYLDRKAGGATDEDLDFMPVREYVDSIRDWLSVKSRRLRSR